jgi:hypothetical protein
MEVNNAQNASNTSQSPEQKGGTNPEHRHSANPSFGGIHEFIKQTTLIGNVITAAGSTKNSSEPLPFTDRSLFEEIYGNSRAESLNCSRKLLASNSSFFLKKKSVRLGELDTRIYIDKRI